MGRRKSGRTGMNRGPFDLIIFDYDGVIADSELLNNAVMAELLSTADGVGAALAVTRAQLDTSGTLAWVVAVLAALLATEYLLLEPVKRHVERWRQQEDA